MVIMSASLVMCSVTVLLGIFSFLLHRFFKKRFSYWEERNVPYIKPSLLFGSLKGVFLKRESWISLFEKWYREFKSSGFGGTYFLTEPVVLVSDRELIDKILVQDFTYFHDRFPEFDQRIALANGLTYVTGDKWKELHLKIAPAFSSSKIKGMFEQILDCTGEVLAKIDISIDRNESLPIDNVSYMYTAQTIAKCTFGVQLFTDTAECRSFQNIFDLLYEQSFFSTLFNMLINFNPKITNLFKFDMLPSKLSKLYLELTKNIIKHRESNKVTRNDFLQLLLDLKEQGEIWGSKNGTRIAGGKNVSRNKDTDSDTPTTGCEPNLNRKYLFNDHSISMIMFNLLIAGLKSTATTLSFAMFEIAMDSSIQNKLHEEIDAALQKHGGWSFEAVKSMTYLDQVIQETLRLHCFNISLLRYTTKDYKVPGTDVTLEKGKYVIIPIAAIHRDAQYYPSPQVFNPNRFHGNNYKPSATFLPFGLGPRLCIGMRFTIQIMKSYLARILSEHVVRPSSLMKLPMEYEDLGFTPRAKGGIILKFSKRNTFSR